MSLYTSCFSHCLNKQFRGKRFVTVHSSGGKKVRAAGVAWPYNSGNLQHDLEDKETESSSYKVNMTFSPQLPGFVSYVPRPKSSTTPKTELPT